jgi:enoyl-CoA hydratase/carnithine racemase
VLVTRHHRGSAAVITLDSPANRNALSATLVDELAQHLAAAQVDAGVRAVVLTGTGGTFCAGADLSDPPKNGSTRGSYTAVLRTLWAYPKPVIVAINGHVRAGGFGLVAAADIVLSVQSASFAFTEVRIGVAPAIISVLCLRRMTPSSASRFLLTGERFSAEEAKESGLVTILVGKGGLDSAVDTLLAQLRETEPGAVEVTRGLIRRVPSMDVDLDFDFAEELSARMFSSAPAQEGIAAFRERRPPEWAASASSKYE